jgi:ribulose-phosphate 3-epimerase
MFVSGSGIFGKANPTDAHRYDSIISKMREAMATVSR